MMLGGDQVSPTVVVVPWYHGTKGNLGKECGDGGNNGRRFPHHSKAVISSMHLHLYLLGGGVNGLMVSV